MLGFLSKEGHFIECKEYNHLNLGNKILKKYI